MRVRETPRPVVELVYPSLDNREQSIPESRSHPRRCLTHGLWLVLPTPPRRREFPESEGLRARFETDSFGRQFYTHLWNFFSASDEYRSMNIIRNALALCFVMLVASNALSQEKRALREVDRIRLIEAFRLSEKLADDLWAGWTKAPFAVLLVTSDKEFLIRHPRPSEDFTSLGYDPQLKSDVYYRDRKFATNLLATFPAVGGVSTIVIGQAENTASKTSTPWIITLLHEHFHQLQDSQPRYEETLKLNLSGGDQTGMWMLNYPFPYASAEVSQQFTILARLLVEALEAKTKVL